LMGKDSEKLAGAALSVLSGKSVTYADARFESIRHERLESSSGALSNLSHSTDRGFGIRVLKKGGWGFASSSILTEAEVRRIALLAVEIAEASATLLGEPAELTPGQAIKGSYNTRVLRNPFDMTTKEKVDYLLHLESLVQNRPQIRLTSSSLDFRQLEKLFVSTEGSHITQTILHSGAGQSVTAFGEGRQMATRSYPTSQGGQFKSGGFEIIEQMGFESGAEKICEEVQQLLSASPCPNERTTLVIDGSQVSMQIHESVGHALEFDRVLGEEANFSGTSFATPDKFGTLQYASNIVNIVADPTAEGGLGSFGFDDEGVPARKVDLIRSGILTGYLSSRETAARHHVPLSSSMRAETWSHVPIVRMTNTILLPGTTPLKDVISEVEEGIFMSSTSSWSIDDRREDFRFGCEIGWKIRNGELAEVVSRPSYSGNTIEFWNSCDAIADSDSYELWGTPNCGKGQPSQNARTSQGAPAARFRNVEVGT
jgi:TldD protein